MPLKKFLKRSNSSSNKSADSSQGVTQNSKILKSLKSREGIDSQKEILSPSGSGNVDDKTVSTPKSSDESRQRRREAFLNSKKHSMNEAIFRIRKKERLEELDNLGSMKRVQKGLNRIAVKDVMKNREKSVLLPEKSDAPLTMHDNQGVEIALVNLREAMFNYIKALRKREEIRARWNMGRFNRIKDKTGVRQMIFKSIKENLKEAKKDYKEKKKTAKKYLKESRKRDKEIIAEINRMDSEIIGLNQEEIDEARESEKVLAKHGKKKVEKIRRVKKTLSSSETKFKSLKRELAELTKAGVGRKDFTYKFGINLSLSLSETVKIKIGGGILYSGSVSIEDDRNFRVSSSWGAYGKGKMSILAAISGELGAEFLKTNTEKYTDVDQWAATLAFRVGKIKKALAKIKKKPSIEEDVEELYGKSSEAAEVLLEKKRIADHGEVVNISSKSAKGTIDVNALWAGAGGSYEKTWMTYKKKDSQKRTLKRKGKKSVKEFYFSPTSNLSIIISQTKIKGDPNPDNNGNYWNIKLAVTGKLALAISFVGGDEKLKRFKQLERSMALILGKKGLVSGAKGLASLKDHDGGGGGGAGLLDPVKGALGGLKTELTDKVDPSQIAKSISDLLSYTFTVDYKSFLGSSDLDFGFTYNKSKTWAVEWNFVKVNGKKLPRLQYRRFTEGVSSEISLNGQASYYGVGVGGEIGRTKNKTVMMKEVLGTETITYIKTVFNGLRARDKRDEKLKRLHGLGQWHAFVLKHKKEFWQAFRHISKGEGNIYSEVSESIEDAKQELGSDISEENKAVLQNATEAAARFLALCVSYKDKLSEKEIDPKVFSEIERALFKYLDNLGKLTDVIEAGKWKVSKSRLSRLPFRKKKSSAV